jgi:predicted O-methyltransferase YrrM
MTHTVKLFKEPLKIRDNLSEDGAEMSELQLSMLCGLIKEYRPQKIVEVGVAAGGTTAVILNCLSLIELDTWVYSVDLSERYYRDTSKKTGYLAEEYKKLTNKKVNHRQYGRGYLPQYIDDIGKNIDFLIIDTLHILPGEVLDFLVSLPYLKDGAIVILHDIFMNHHNHQLESYATRLLLSVVVGEKIVGRGADNKYNYIELGAFRITKDTRKYIENVFSALLITWQYIPDKLQMNIYKGFLSRYYDDRLMEEFEIAEKLNEKTVYQKKIDNKICMIKVHNLIKSLENKKNIFVYGCGTVGEKLYNLLEAFGIELSGFVISDDQIKPHKGRRIEYISDLVNDNCTFVLGMSTENQKQVYRESMKDNWIQIDHDVLHFLSSSL